jgi:two-component system response regulator YesN
MGQLSGVGPMLKSLRNIVENRLRTKRNLNVLFAYFVVGNMMVAGIFGTLLYIRSARSLEQQTIEANQNMLIQLNRSADLLLSQVDQYLSRLALETSVSDFMRYYQSKDLLGQNRVNATIDNNLLLSRYINSISIFYFHDNKVYSTNRGVRELKDFPDRALFEAAKRGRLNYNWLPTRSLWDEKSGETIKVITIIKPVPLGSFEPEAVIIVNINESFLRESMNAIIGNEELEVLVVDEHARFISSNQLASPHALQRQKSNLQRAFRQKSGYYPSKISRKKVIVSFVTSEAFGWKYISIIPYQAIVAKIRFIRNYAIIISFLAVLLGIAVALFFSNRFFQPIRLIAGLLKDEESPSRENDLLKYIETNVNRLVAKNEKIEKTINEHLPVLRSNFLGGLLKGSVTGPAEIDERLRYYGINLGDSAAFVVFLFHTNRGTVAEAENEAEFQHNLRAVYLMEQISGLPVEAKSTILVNTEENEIAVIFGLQGNDTETWEEHTARIGAAIHQIFQSHKTDRYAIAVGAVKKEIYRIADSYREAREAMHYRVLIGNQKIICYAAIQNLKAENYEYPYREETELIAAIKQGELQAVTRASQAIFEVFVSCNAAMGDTVYYHYMQLLSSIIRSLLEIGMNVESLLGEANLYQELLKCRGMAEVRDWFNYIFKEISVQVQRRKDTKNRGVIETIVKYVHEYYNRDLSLTVLSRQVFLSVPYLSTVFKEEYGQPLKQFINEVRIEKAKELLADPGLQITEVAERVGYDKVHAFLRLFKEYTGMTPGQYRKNIFCFQKERKHHGRDTAN